MNARRCGSGGLGPIVPFVLSTVLFAAGCSGQDPPGSDVVRPVMTAVVAAGGDTRVRSSAMSTAPGSSEDPPPVAFKYREESR
jgi:hypothetical protein